MKHAPRVTSVLLALAFLISLAPAGAAQSAVEPLDSREAFADAAAQLTAVSLEAVAPARGFGMYRPGTSLSVGGASFRASGGARFGPGVIYVLSPAYAASNPMYNTGTGAVLSWASPNQPGNVSLDVTLPAGVTAVGADLWTQQPYVSTVEVMAVTADGGSLTVAVSTRARPEAAFIGFISESPIVAVSFRPPRGQTGILLDNLVYGRKAEGRAVRPPADPLPKDADWMAALTGRTTGQTPSAGPSPAAQATPTPAPAAPAPTTPPAPTTSPSTPSPTATSSAPPTMPAPTAGKGRGTIAYIRGGTEIRLVEADGSNDRRLWTHPDATADLGLDSLAWRPDGQELAFSSGHAAASSLYHSDLYAVRPDGAGLRKLTNPPDRSEFARYPKGSVSVTLTNTQPAYRQAQASAGVFTVYVAGADLPQQVTLPPGSTTTLTFKSVADFGEVAQAVVAVWGKFRWFTPGVDVRAGAAVEAPPFNISGDGVELLGAFEPVWRADGSRVSYRSGLCLINSVPARPRDGEYVFAPLFKGPHPSGACAWDWGPTQALADQLIYTENSSGGSAVYRAREGGTHPGARLHAFSDLGHQLLHDLRWLPDGSGFLYSQTNPMQDSSNIFRYDFAARRATQVTRLEGEFARRFDLSPDGGWIVFERARAADDYANVDLWVARADGTGARLLVRGGLSPSWR